jgi:hypothetical protein
MGQLQHIRRIRWNPDGTEKFCSGLASIKFIPLFALLTVLALPAFGQDQFRKIKSTTLDTEVNTAAIDRVGELYLITTDNRLVRFGIDGEISAKASLGKTPDLFDPRDGSHSFLYWRNEQRYELRLPDLESVSTSGHIDSSFAIHPFLVCPSGDHDLLVLDSADWSLKKVITKDNSVLYETIIFDGKVTASDIAFIREYQNFIFVLDKSNGIRIYNRMGKLIRMIKGSSIAYFNFLGEELYYPEGDSIKFFNLFSTEERTVRMPAPFEYAFLTDERLFLVNKKLVDIYSIIQ